jgi:Terminase DNA packaging enzyme
MTTETMSEIDKNLSKILEIEPAKEMDEEVLPAVVTEENEQPVLLDIKNADRDIAYDYEFSRITHRELIDKGTELLENAARVATESQHPRAFEVAGQLLKIVSDMTDKVMVLQKTKKELETSIKRGGQQEQSAITVEQAVFVGSTSELLKQVRRDSA